MFQDVNAQNVEHVKEMERMLSEEQMKVESLLSELCDLNNARQQVASLKTELDKMKKSRTEYENDLKKELIDTIDRANCMEQNYNELLDKVEGNSQIGDELAILKEQLFNLSKTLGEKEKQNEELKKWEETSNITIQEQKQQIDELQCKLNKFEFKLQEAETYNKLLGEGEQMLKSKCAEMSNLLTQVNQLKDELTDTQNKYRTMQDHNESLKKELNEYTAFSNNKLMDIDKKYNNDIQNLKQTLEEYSSKLSNKEKELSEEKIKVDEHEREFSSIQKELIDLRRNLEIKQNYLNDKETEISFLKKEVEQFKTELGKSEKNTEFVNNEFSIKIKDLMKAVEDSNAKISDLNIEKSKIFSNGQTEINSLKGEITILQVNISEIKELYDKQKIELAAKNENIVDIQRSCSELESLCKKQASELESKTLQMTKLDHDLSGNINSINLVRNYFCI